MAALPSNMGTCLIVGKFIRAVVDTADADRDPDGLPIEDVSVTFTASVATVRNLSASPPLTVVLDPIVCTTDATGTLIGPDGAPGIRLVASNDPDLDPTGWTYKVRMVAPTMPLLEFSFVAPEGGTVDLSTLVPVPASPGAELIAWQEAVAAAEAARDAAIAAAEGGASTPDATTTTKGKLRLAGDLGGTADAPTVPGLAGKAATSHTHTQAQVTGLSTTLAAKADLVGGVIPTAQLPPLAINDTFTVATQAAMLALTAQRGDLAIRTDVGKVFVLATDSPATLADWKEILAPGTVVSVAGKTGVVSLVKGDVGLGSVDNTADANKPVSTAQQAAIDATRGAYVGVNAQAGTSYTPVLADRGKLVTLTNAGAITVTLPSNATAAFPIGAQIDFVVLGAGMATFAAGSGATANATPSLVTRAQYSAATAIKISTNGWLVVGDLA